MVDGREFATFHTLENSSSKKTSTRVDKKKKCIGKITGTCPSINQHQIIKLLTDLKINKAVARSDTTESPERTRSIYKLPPQSTSYYYILFNMVFISACLVIYNLLNLEDEDEHAVLMIMDVYCF